MVEKILVIKPNSTEAVTQGIDEACARLRIPGGPLTECVTLKEGPPGNQTQSHVAGVIAPMLQLVRELMAVRREREQLKTELARLEEQMAGYLKELGYE